jgi:hypothetical protein
MFDDMMLQRSGEQTQARYISKAVSDGSMAVDFALVMTRPARAVRSIDLPTNPQLVGIFITEL